MTRLGEELFSFLSCFFARMLTIGHEFLRVVRVTTRVSQISYGNLRVVRGPHFNTQYIIKQNPIFTCTAIMST